ncbi:MAG: DUF5018 domain-containing protein, partial [Bacteroidota bacterium]
ATSSNSIPLNNWVHVVGTYGGGSMEIYIDGVQNANATSSGAPAKPSGAMLVGLNNQQNSPTDAVFEPQTYPSIFGFEGLIDEIIFYNTKLTESEVSQSFARLADGTIKANPDIELRILPGQPGVAANFGATHSRLSYHDLWDNMWRVSEFEDVTVKFEDLPTSYVYWRGTTHGVNMVTENNLWMSDQSEEIFCGENGFPPNPSGNLSLSEHMSDKEARYSHIRVLENTSARVVVHWRYGVSDIFLDQCDDRNFVDEYHTIYPDGTLYRNLQFWANGSTTVPSDLQPLTSPGLLYSDIVNEDALSVTDLEGNTRNLNWNNGIPEGENEILMANFKANWKIYEAFQLGNTGGPWGATNQSARSAAPYAGPWNHWPVSRIVSDGRQAWDGDGRLHHFALSTGGGGSAMMYGFSNQESTSNQNVNAVIPAVNGWRNAAAITEVTGASSQGYNVNQREYNFTRSGADITFTLEGSNANPVYNPCFVIKNWSSSNPSTLHINGIPSTDFKQGIIYDTDGTQTLVIYAPIEASATTTFAIAETQNSDTDILSFSLAEQSATATIDQVNHTVAIEVVANNDLTALTPTINVSQGAVISPPSGAAQDFSNQVNYTVTAQDGSSTQDWVITVTIGEQNMDTDILSFSLPEQTSSASIDAVNHAVSVEVDAESDVTSLTPTIGISAGASLSPVSGVTQDFTNPITYTVTSEDGLTSQDWTVTVTSANVTVGLEEVNGWKIYPNPASNTLYIKTENSVRVILKDIMGRNVVEGAEGTEIALSMTGLKPGVYILYINEGKKVETRKIIKSHN